jgi:CRISPR-associated endonuclease/helicase Cas3
MRKIIPLPGLRAENLLGFLAALGLYRIIQVETQSAKLLWMPDGGGWCAALEVPDSSYSDAEQVSLGVAAILDGLPKPHWILDWERFLTKSFQDETDYFRSSALAWLSGEKNHEHSAVFTAQLPELSAVGEREHFDHPFRAARKDFYPGNLESVLKSTNASHLLRAIARPWDYMDAMANQSLRLDHGDDRRHAYQWHAPTEDPARQKVGCMLGANRLAIEAFPFFPCLPQADGGTAVGFTCSSKTYTWITWPVWSKPCSLEVIASLLNHRLLAKDTEDKGSLEAIGVVAVFESRRLPVEKNKVFLPPTLK